MAIEYIRYTLVEHEPAELIAAYEEACKHLGAAPECLAYELAQCDEEPKSFILRIEWTSAEAHTQGFRRGPHFPQFLTAIRAFVPEIAEMRHYEAKIVSHS
ncbi:putative quinol monooxygenase [Sphingomonas sp. DT-204]|uniref:putative quinol monooxygenase n=1 Tax=Sphingomonas sp. DT-204 TaxID=3396166 RepID=UPI003F1D7BB5